MQPYDDSTFITCPVDEQPTGHVRRVQEAVNALNLPTMSLVPDDDFGPKTRRGIHAGREWLLRDGFMTVHELERLEALGEAYATGQRIREAHPEWTPPAENYQELDRAYGGFRHVPRPGQKGWINITTKDPAYRIVKAGLPLVGSEWIHAKLVGPLTALLDEVVRMGRWVGDDLSTYATRHICRDPNKRLSIHSWGIAFDIEPPANRMGRRGFVDPFVVQVARGMGFTWGGTWGSTRSDRDKGMDGNVVLNERKSFGAGKDDMHFEWFAGNRLHRPRNG